MKIFENLQQWQKFRDEMARHGQTLGFVPTMGALHEGHLSLVKRAKEKHDHVLASIFVNPTQFNNKDDLEKYPRTLHQDLALLSGIECDFVLLPSEAEIYADHNKFKIEETDESKILCGAYRPGHFSGVLTIVLKLLGLAQADSCYMGEKDFQQLRLIQKLAKSFFVKTRIEACPTVREANGLAMSSRNERLSSEGRQKAALIYKILKSSATCNEVKTQLTKAGFQVEYCEEHWGRRLVAAHLEGVRLIDNIEMKSE
jgi:pantoate--beta-alanine ligase